MEDSDQRIEGVEEDRDRYKKEIQDLLKIIDMYEAVTQKFLSPELDSFLNKLRKRYKK
jgi:hypothetical protein